jgi:hypothetical protein
MSVKFKMNPAFERKLKDLAKPKQVSLEELMPSTFMRANTQFQSIQEMFDKSEFTDVDLEALPSILESSAWSSYVGQRTRFKNWNDMLAAAAAENMRKRLGT